MSSIKINFCSLPPTHLISKSQLLVEKLSSNRFFPNPQPSIAMLAARKEILDSWIRKAGYNEGRAIAMRDKAYRTLTEMVSELAHYVEKTSLGNPEIIMTSGFEVADDEHTTSNTKAYPHQILIEPTQTEGTLNLSWEPIEGQHAYVVQMTTKNVNSTDPTWITVSVTTKNRVEITNLTKGNSYYFRLKMVDRDCESRYSQVTAICAG